MITDRCNKQVQEEIWDGAERADVPDETTPLGRSKPILCNIGVSKSLKVFLIFSFTSPMFIWDQNVLLFPHYYMKLCSSGISQARTYTLPKLHFLFLVHSGSKCTGLRSFFFFFFKLRMLCISPICCGP